MKIKNVLVFPADNELGLEIIDSIKYNKDIILYSAGTNQLEIDFPFHKKHFIISENLIKRGFNDLNHIIEQNKIDFVYPTDDERNIEFAQNRNKISAQMILSPTIALSIVMSKQKTLEVLKDVVPISTNEISGKIYNIGCISDRKRGLLFCAGIENLESIPKTLFNSRSLTRKIFNEYAEKILRSIDLYGAWSFRIEERKKDEFNLIDITPWMSTEMSFFRYLGVNFPLLSIYECDRDNFQVMPNNYNIRFFNKPKKKYEISITYRTIYVDFDDTLVIKNALNVQMMNFLNQCIKNNKRIILITKHQGDIENTLKKFKIPLENFDKILHLDVDDEKSKYINEPDSIYIDDSYNERKEIKELIEIPVFDISMIEGLIKNLNNQ